MRPLPSQLVIDFERCSRLGHLREALGRLAELVGERELRFCFALVTLADQYSAGADLVHCRASLTQVAQQMEVSINTARLAKQRLIAADLLVESAKPGEASEFLLDASRIFAIEPPQSDNQLEGSTHPSNPSKIFCTPPVFSVGGGVEGSRVGGVPEGSPIGAEKSLARFQAEKRDSPNFGGVNHPSSGTPFAKHVLYKHVIKEHVQHVAREPGGVPPSRRSIRRIDEVVLTEADLIDPQALQSVFEIVAANHRRDPARWRKPSEQLRLWVFASGRCVHRAKHLTSRLAAFKAGLRPGGTILPSQDDEDWASRQIKLLDFPASEQSIGSQGTNLVDGLASDQRPRSPPAAAAPREPIHERSIDHDRGEQVARLAERYPNLLKGMK